MHNTLSNSKPTIIIAAYNEANIIQGTLSLLESGVNSGHFQVVVVCNGCTDNTQDIVQKKFTSVLCYSIKPASKALAIRFAESLKLGYPRLYLDADIELSSEHAKGLFDTASSYQEAGLFIPSSTVETTNCQTLVKRFYRAWYCTPFVKSLGFGAGAYLLNQKGRDRFGEWPELIADDGFVRSQFELSETHISNNAKALVKAPKTITDLINVKTRSKFGNLELKRYLSTQKSVIKNSPQFKQASSNPPLNTLDRLTYIAVNIIALVFAKWRFFRGINSWSRDSSNH